MSVTAKDKNTNKQQSITISGASNLAKDEVEKMVEEAEKNAAADKERSSQIEVKNQSDALCYETKKQLQTLEASLSSNQKDKIESLITSLETAIQNDDYATMKNLNEELQSELKNISEQVAAGAAAAAAGSPQPGTGGDDVIETDFSTEK